MSAPYSLPAALNRIAELEDELAFMRRQAGIDADAQEVEAIRAALRISPKTAEVLSALHRARGRVVSRDKLMSLIYSSGEYEPAEGIIGVWIWKIRQAFSAMRQPDPIQCAWGNGYSLTDSAIALCDGVAERVRAA